MLIDQVVNTEQTEGPESTPESEPVKQTEPETQAPVSGHVGSKKKPAAATTNPVAEPEPEPEMVLRVPKYRGERPMVYKKGANAGIKSQPNVNVHRQNGPSSVNNESEQDLETSEKRRKTSNVKKQNHKPIAQESDDKAELKAKVRFEDNVDVIDKRQTEDKVKAKGKIHRKGVNSTTPWYQQSKIT